MDFVTKLPPSKRAGIVYNSILVIVDRFTKIARYLAIKKTITAEELRELFFFKIAYRFGIPAGVVSNRGLVFTSTF